MAGFFAQVINTTRSFFADRGGPIAMAQVRWTNDSLFIIWPCSPARQARPHLFHCFPKRQVENELHTSDAAYVSFCGSLAAEYMLGNQWGV